MQQNDMKVHTKEVSSFVYSLHSTYIYDTCTYMQREGEIDRHIHTHVSPFNIIRLQCTCTCTL